MSASASDRERRADTIFVGAEENAASAPEPPMDSWRWLALHSIARGYLAFFLTLLAAAIVPAIGGWHTYLVAGNSMAPAIQAGDLAVMSPIVVSDPLPVGRVMSFTSSSTPTNTPRVVIHRVVRQEDDGSYTTAGDANRTVDGDALDPTTVTGQGRLLIPWAGLPALWWRQGDLLMVLGWVLVTGAAVAIAIRRFRQWSSRRAASGTDPPDSALATPGGAGNDPRAPADGSDSIAMPIFRWRWLAVGTLIALSYSLVTTASAAFTGEARTSGNAWSVAAPIVQPYTDAVLADSPWAYYPLDEAAGPTMTDASGHSGRSGTYTAPITYRQPGAVTSEAGYAATLAGAGGRSVAATASTASTAPATYSIELWFKTSTTQGGKLMGFESGKSATSSTYDRHVFMRTDGRITYGGWSGAGTIRTLTPEVAYNDGRWHHLVITCRPSGSSQSSRIYVDGDSVASGTTTGVSSYSGYWRVGFGSLSTGSGYPSSANFAGDLDDVAIYSTELSNSRVQTHYAKR